MRTARARPLVFLRSRSVGSGAVSGSVAVAKLVASQLWAWLGRCRARAAERRALARLTDWDLRDIGITRADAETESEKWPWRQ